MSRPPARERAPQPIVFTDLDGTLLDHATYSFAPAAGTLTELRRRHTPVVLATSKTRAEVRPLMRALGLESPAIVENGGALLLPRGHLRTPAGARRLRGFDLLPLGAERPALVRALREIAGETGARLRGFADMTSREVRERTALSGEAVRHAREREFDEPFVLETPALAPALAQAARRRGLRVTRGGRFYHLTGDTDKGAAVRRLLALYAADGRIFFSVGLGDAANDVDMLRAVDRPILVPRPDGSFDPELERALPDAERAPAPGPAGWSAAVRRALRGGTPAAPPRELQPS
jgi:mannosyl-3-phosphoglycerate phosphatase family protein